jgi:hypothetical protein
MLRYEVTYRFQGVFHLSGSWVCPVLIAFQGEGGGALVRFAKVTRAKALAR